MFKSLARLKSFVLPYRGRLGRGIAAFGVARVFAVSCEPASEAGQVGLRLLASQTAQLLSGDGVDDEEGARQFAFNCVPQVGEFVADGATRGELLIERHVRRILDRPELDIHVLGVRVPTFFGNGYAVDIETHETFDPLEIERSLRSSPGVVVLDDPQGGRCPTSMDGMQMDAVIVGVALGLGLWGGR